MLLAVAVVSAQDVTPPVFLKCPKDTLVFTDAKNPLTPDVPGSPNATFTYTIHVVDETDGTIIPDGTSFTDQYSTVGSPHEILVTIADNANNVAKCRFLLTVLDNEPPTFVKSRSTSQLTVQSVLDDATGNLVGHFECGTIVNKVGRATANGCVVNVTDNVNVTQLSYAPTGLLPIGVTTITYTALDAAGNINTHTIQVTVAENQAAQFAQQKYQLQKQLEVFLFFFFRNEKRKKRECRTVTPLNTYK